MKLKAIIVRLNSPTGGKSEYIYSDTGFFREIQIFEGDRLVHKSGANHPESAFTTHFNGFEFYSPSNSTEVFVKVNNQIEFK